MKKFKIQNEVKDKWSQKGKKSYDVNREQPFFQTILNKVNPLIQIHTKLNSILVLAPFFRRVYPEKLSSLCNR